MSRSHPMPYRILWTWDSWVCDPFSAESYVAEYRELIDFAARTGYNGIIIWGFVDGRHGGIETARQVAEYGLQQGVRILPGVGAGGYHGYSITPGLPYHLEDLLREKPYLRAQIRGSHRVVDHAGCLYQPEFQEWLHEGAEWLAATFPIGGVNIETNEMDWICDCPLTSEATRQEPNRLKYANSYSDLAIAVPIIFEGIRRKHPDAWVTYATYEPAWFRRMEDAWLLERIPREAIAQWNMELDCDASVPPPVPENISLIHSGGWSYHLDAFPPTWTFTQYRCFWPLLRQARQFGANQRAMGVQGLVLGCVGSAAMPDNEANYIAYLEFSRDPNMDCETFAAEHLAPLYGEPAAPLVLRLMLAQEELHPKLAPVWSGWAWFLREGCPSRRLLAAEESVLKEWEDQLALARRAREAASPEGAKRLDVIAQVLDEYLRIGRFSRTGAAAAMIQDQERLRNNPAEAAAASGQLVADLELPGEIYGPRQGSGQDSG